MEPHENPDAAPPVEPSATPSAETRAPAPVATLSGPFEVENDPRVASEPVLLENPHPVAAAPSESMEGAVTLEAADVSEVERSVLAPLELEPAASAAEPTLLENPNEPLPAPSEGSADVVTLEAPDVVHASPETGTLTVGPAPEAPRPVRVLPRRPRLRVTFHYDARDDLNVELTLMDERRELIHRMNTRAEQGGAIARIFEVLLGVATSAAAAVGVFGSRER